MHEAPRIAAPVVLRIGREGQHRSRDFLRDALFKHRSYASELLAFSISRCVLPNLVLDRLEAQETGLPVVASWHVLGSIFE